MALANSYVFVALLCSAFVVTYVTSADPKEHQFESASQKECFKELGVDEKNPKASNVPLEKVTACILKKDGILTSDGKFETDKLEKIFTTDIKDEKQRAKAISFVSECGKEINSAKRTEEEATKMVMECFDNLETELSKKD